MTLAAKTNSPVHVESTRFRSAVSESLLSQMGGNINYLLSAVLPVGSVIHSYLTEAQFQDEIGSTDWVLDQGQNIAGTKLALVTGITTLADLRGVTIRGKNNGRSTASGNTAGELAIGAYQADALLRHRHGYNYTGIYGDGGYASGDTRGQLYASNTDYAGDDVGETRVRSVTLNTFVRVN